MVFKTQIWVLGVLIVTTVLLIWGPSLSILYVSQYFSRLLLSFNFVYEICWNTYGIMFARAAIMKYYRLDGLNNRYLFSHSSGGWKSKIKVLAYLIFSWGLPPWIADGHILTVSSRGHTLVHVCVLISSSCKNTSHIGFRPTLNTSFEFNCLFKDLISKYSSILRYCGLGLQHTSFARGT